MLDAGRAARDVRRRGHLHRDAQRDLRRDVRGLRRDVLVRRRLRGRWRLLPRQVRVLRLRRPSTTARPLLLSSLPDTRVSNAEVRAVRPVIVIPATVLLLTAAASAGAGGEPPDD